MNATLGVELPFTTPPSRRRSPWVLSIRPPRSSGPNETQLWKITHNGVDTHGIHFHLFNVQVINRVGWDGAIRPPDPNELGWKETVRMNPLEDIIVAMRAKVPTYPFSVPNSIRPLNPALPVGSTFASFDPLTGAPDYRHQRMTNFGHEYVWHCHILGHEENDMMRPMVLNADQLLYVSTRATGIWQWDLGTWTQINAAVPTTWWPQVAHVCERRGVRSLQWNGSTWTRINTAFRPAWWLRLDLVCELRGHGLYSWNGSAWTQINTSAPTSMVAVRLDFCMRASGHPASIAGTAVPGRD